MNKDQAQTQMLERFKKTQLMYFLISMGVGKTRGSLNCVQWLHEYVRTNTMLIAPKGLIVCHTADSRDKTWPKEIQESHPWLIPEIKAGNVQLVHRDHVLKLPPEIYAWVIWDECHLIKKEHFGFFARNKFNGLILMSGTKHDDPVLQNAIIKLVQNNIMEISVEQAIDQEIINDYRVKVIKVPLHDHEREAHTKIAIKLGKSAYISHEFRNQVIGERMRFIYDLPSKFEALQRMSETLRSHSKRQLVFVNRKEQCPAVSCNIYHSGTKDKALTAFAEGIIDTLVSIKQLRTGSNFKNFDTICSLQVNSKASTFMQDLGRLFRLDVGQIGTIYTFYADNTQDMVWSDKAMVNIPKEKMRVYDWDHTMSYRQVQEIIDDTF